MTFKVINDLHGNRGLIDSVIGKFAENDIIVINGDFAGGRGKTMMEVAKLFYEVRRGETPKRQLEEKLEEITGEDRVIISNELVYESVHGGTFQKFLIDHSDKIREITKRESEENLEILRDFRARVKAAKVIYIPGNNELNPLDFDVTGGVDKEVLVDSRDRYYNILHKKGFFRRMGVVYGTTITSIDDEGTMALSNDYVDAWISGKVKSRDIEFKGIKKAITHHPPYSEDILRYFRNLMNYSDNEVGFARMKAVAEILERCPDLEKVTFGHIHRGITVEEVETLPETVEFDMGNYVAIWNRPGHVLDF